MFWRLPALGAALAFVQSVASGSTAQDALAPRQLRPIHLRNYESSFGLHRRASEQFSSLDPQTQSQLIYGSPLENEQLLLANMTLYAPDGLLMVLLEEFDDLTSAVDCAGTEGMMSLTFKNQDAFNYALKTWNYVNEKDDSKFLVIANHDGCGPNDQRQPYLVSGIREDATTFTTYLTAQTAPWSDVAGTYDMDFGKAIPFQRPSSLQTRGLWGDITKAVKGAASDVKKGADDVVNGVKSVASNVGNDVKSVASDVGTDVKSVASDVASGAKTAASDVAGVASDVGNAVTGTIDLSKSVSFGMNAGTPHETTLLFTDNTHLTLDCINCYISGSVEVTGHISVDHFKLKDLTIDGTPHGLKGAVEMEAQITKYEKPDAWKFTKDLFSAPVPDAGIEVPGIFKIGAILSYQVGVSASLQGSATIDFGLGLNVPDTADIHADIMNPGSSTAQGLSGDITPLFDLKSITATLAFAAFAQPKLSFGVDLTEIGTLDVALTFKMPQIDVKFIAGYNESGLCSHGLGASKTGVEIETQIGLELDLQIDASLGPDSTMKPSYWMKLWSDYHTLSSSCWPIAIPGLSGPSNSLTALPPQPSATGNGSNIPVANFSLLTGSAYSTYAKPTYLPSGVRSAAPLSGNASSVAVPTGFLKTTVSGAAQSTGVFSTNGRASGTGFPYPIRPSGASSVLPSGSGFTKLPTGSGFQTMPPGTGISASGIYPSMPTGSPPPPPSGSPASSGRFPPVPTISPPFSPSGTAASIGFARPSNSKVKSHGTKHRSHTESETHTAHTKSTHTEVPYPTETSSFGTSTSGSASSTGAANASHHRFRY